MEPTAGTPAGATPKPPASAAGAGKWWPPRLDAPLRGVVAVLLGVLLAVPLAGSYLTMQSEERATDWVSALRADTVPPPVGSVLPQFRTGDPVSLRLRRQLDITRRRQVFHQDITVFFYARYYMALTIASVAGLLAAAMLVLLTRIGWERAHPALKATFMAAAGVTAFFAAFPGMFRQNENIAENAALYAAYSNLENEILSYLATQEDFEGKALRPAAFVHTVDRRLVDLNRIAIGFDATKLPASAAFQGLDK